MNYSVPGRLTTIIAAVALVSMTSAVRADPPSVPNQSAKPAATHPANIQLASAEQAQKGSAPNTPSTATARKPASRVTTCRCGGQVVDPSDDETDQPQD